jgi:hypothetical protein
MSEVRSSVVTAREIFETLTDPAARQGRIVTVRLGISPLNQRNPSLVLVLALGEEERLGASLVCLAINVLDVLAIDLLEESQQGDLR